MIIKSWMSPVNVWCSCLKILSQALRKESHVSNRSQQQVVFNSPPVVLSCAYLLCIVILCCFPNLPCALLQEGCLLKMHIPFCGYYFFSSSYFSLDLYLIGSFSKLTGVIRNFSMPTNFCLPVTTCSMTRY